MREEVDLKAVVAILAWQRGHHTGPRFCFAVQSAWRSIHRSCDETSKKIGPCDRGSERQSEANLSCDF
jgi:hypothetical protein